MDPFERWKQVIVHVGVFLVFLATFGEYVFEKLWDVIGPLFSP